MDFSIALQDVKSTVDKELRIFFLEKRKEAQIIHPRTIPLVDAVADFTIRGGKRTRAFLVWLGYKTVKSDKRNVINRMLMDAMTAIELFESFALIHDDIIDEDTQRRGGPSVHEVFRVNALSHSHDTSQNTKHFGESMAILAGDLAVAWADEAIEKIQEQKPKILYQKMKQEVLLGQGLDVLAASGMPSATRLTINAYKTTWYTVIRPLQIGAAIGGADEQMIAQFIPYGLAVGEAYQLRDDALDGDISGAQFRARSVVLGRQAYEAARAIHAPERVVQLLVDFARFALDRPA